MQASYNEISRGDETMLDQELVQLFFEGKCSEAYKIFGSHFHKEGTSFCVYAPHAMHVQLICEQFNWQPITMDKVSEEGIYYLYLENIMEGTLYKYHILTANYQWIDKVDPYAFYSLLKPKTASMVCNLAYDWQDELWMKQRNNGYNVPINIYEIHLGSWKLRHDHEIYNYEQIAEELIPYIKKMGYSHVEFMPLSEYLYDKSWGYQPTGYFSPTSRYGRPTQLMKLVDLCHQNNIGVILDFVPFHFIHTKEGLNLFDGKPLYENLDLKKRYSPWGTSYFDLSKEEVRSFMISSAVYWLDYYHIDGLCFNKFYYQGNKNNRLNEGEVEFIKCCNALCHSRFPGTLTIAKDSMDYSKVTQSINQGGLGFDYIWDSKWVKETLNYLSKDPIYRFYHHQQITFSMSYFYNEKYILPLSHDIIIHSQKMIFNKLWGDHYQQFSQLKSLYLYMYTHPGKKLSFMGNEFASLKEWDEQKSLEWNLLNDPVHQTFFYFIQKLNQIYKQEKALSYFDYDRGGFCWLVKKDNYQNVFAYQRCYKKNVLVIVINFGSSKHYGYPTPVPIDGEYEELLNTDQDIYIGSHFINEIIKSKMRRIYVNIAPFASIIFKLKQGG